MSRYPYNAWSPEDNNLLIKLHGDGDSYREITEQFPDRSLGSICGQIFKLGLTKPKFSSKDTVSSTGGIISRPNEWTLIHRKC